MYCLHRPALPRLLDTLPPVVSEAALCQPPCTKRSRPQQHPTAYPAQLLYQRTSQPHLPHSQPKSFARRQQENPRPRSAAAEAPSIKTLSWPSATLPHCLYCLRRCNWRQGCCAILLTTPNTTLFAKECGPDMPSSRPMRRPVLTQVSVGTAQWRARLDSHGARHRAGGIKACCGKARALAAQGRGPCPGQGYALAP